MLFSIYIFYLQLFYCFALFILLTQFFVIVFYCLQKVKLMFKMKFHKQMKLITLKMVFIFVFFFFQFVLHFYLFYIFVVVFCYFRIDLDTKMTEELNGNANVDEVDGPNGNFF